MSEYTIALSVASDEACEAPELLASLAQSVNKMAKDGWTPRGGVVYVSCAKPMAMQAMWKEARRLVSH